MTVTASTETHDTAARRTSSHWRRLLVATVGLLVSATSLYLAFRAADPRALLKLLKNVDPFFLFIAAVIGMSSNFVRAIRWRALFSPNTHVPLRYYFTIMMIGYLGNNVLPARAGDVIRAVLFAKRTGVGVSSTAATLVVERVVDACSLLAVVGIVSFIVPLPSALHEGARIASVACIVMLAILVWAAFRGRAQTPLSDGDSSTIVKRIVTRFAEGLHALRNARSMTTVLALTGTIWLIETVTVYFVMRAAGISAPPLAALFLLVVVSLGLLIPAGPASIGSYELFVVLALSAFAVEKTRALGVGIVLHSLVFLIATTTGLICLWIESIPFRTLPKSRAEWMREAQ
jgi:glycosyltransferase 2 family protein